MFKFFLKRVDFKLYFKFNSVTSQDFILATLGSELETFPSSFLLYNLPILHDVNFLTFSLKSPAKPFLVEKNLADLVHLGL